MNERSTGPRPRIRGRLLDPAACAGCHHFSTRIAHQQVLRIIDKKNYFIFFNISSSVYLFLRLLSAQKTRDRMANESTE